MQFHDYCTVTISGRNPYPLINAVRESPIVCLEQHCTGEVFHCRVRRSDLPALRDLAGAFGMQLTAEEERSVLRRLRGYRLRFGLLIGALLAGLLIFRQSNVIETIDIEGNAAVPEVTILSVLAREGVTRGSWLPHVDMPRCEYAVRMEITGIAWCGIRRYGNHLIVEVAEETPTLPLLEERTPCNIVAAQDATITGVKVLTGYLQQLVGAQVHAGDLLVSGTFEDAYGITTYRHAMAEITGIYTKTAAFSVPRTADTTVLTGRRFRRHALRLFGTELPLTIGSPPFAQARQSESEVPLMLLGMRLPCSTVTVTYEETALTPVTFSPEEAQLALQADIVRYEKNLLTDVTILDRQLSFSETEDALTCTAVYLVEGEIGEEAAFLP